MKIRAEKCKAPFRSKSIVAARLGDVLEIEINNGQSDIVMRWPRGKVRLLWAPKLKSLMWFDGEIESHSTHADEDALFDAVDAFQVFHASLPKRVKTMSWPSSKWMKLGHPYRIDYYSTKWGERASYTHALGPRVQLYRCGPTKGPGIFVICGGSLKITSHGIEG